MLKSIYVAAYLAIAIQFARRLAFKVLPGQEKMYFLAIRANIPGSPMDNTLIVLSCTRRRIRPPGVGWVEPDRLWDTVLMSMDELAEYARGWKIDSVMPLRKAIQYAYYRNCPHNFVSGLESMATAVSPVYSWQEFIVPLRQAIQRKC